MRGGRCVLHECKHFVAAYVLNDPLDGPGETIQAFYNRFGLVLLGAVMDGDCGLDVACLMHGLPQTLAQRSALREDHSLELKHLISCLITHFVNISVNN